MPVANEQKTVDLKVTEDYVTVLSIFLYYKNIIDFTALNFL